MAGVELEPESIIALVQLEPRHLGGDRVPVDVAHGGVDAPNELRASDAEVAEVDPVEQQRDGPRAQHPHLRQGSVGAVQQAKAVGRGGLRVAFGHRSSLSAAANPASLAAKS